MIKMYMDDDDTQKEKIIISSFGGIEDVFMGKSICFRLLGLESYWWRTRSFMLQTYKMQHPIVALPRVHSQSHNSNSKQATLSSRRSPSTSKSVYQPKNTQNFIFQAQIELLSNILARTISISFFPPKIIFLSLNFFSFFLWFSFNITITISKFENQRKCLLVVKNQLFIETFNDRD